MDIPGIYSPGIFHSWNLFLSWNFVFLESYFTEFTCYPQAVLQKICRLDGMADIHIQCQRGIWILINVHGGESIFILFWRWLEWDVRGKNGPSADQGSAVNHRFAAEPNFRNVWNAWELNRHRPIISLFTNQQGGDNRRRHRTSDPRKSQTEKFDFSLNYRGFGQSQFLNLERTDH